MLDDNALIQEFEQLYARGRSSEADDAIAELNKLDRLAAPFLAAIAAAGIKHPDYDERFQSAVETVRNAWANARGDVASAIRHDIS